MTRPHSPEVSRAPARADRSLPLWSRVLRALREAGGLTQEGWATYLGVSRSTVQRWERGEAAPDLAVERVIVALCQERGLFRALDRRALDGEGMSAERLQDLLADARVALRISGPAPSPEREASASGREALHRRVEPGRAGGANAERTGTFPRIAVVVALSLVIVLAIGGGVIARDRRSGSAQPDSPKLSDAAGSAEPVAAVPATDRPALALAPNAQPRVEAPPLMSLIGQTVTDCEDGVKFRVAVRSVDWRIVLDGGKRADPGHIWLVAVVDVTNVDSKAGNYFSAGVIRDETGARFKRVFLQGDIGDLAARYGVEDFVELAPGDSMRWFVVYHIPATVQSLTFLSDTTSVQCA